MTQQQAMTNACLRRDPRRMDGKAERLLQQIDELCSEKLREFRAICPFQSTCELTLDTLASQGYKGDGTAHNLTSTRVDTMKTTEMLGPDTLNEFRLTDLVDQMDPAIGEASSVMGAMATEVIMPALELAQDTGKLLRWLRPAGASVAKGEPIMEIETDKVTVEVEAPAGGTLERSGPLRGTT